MEAKFIIFRAGSIGQYSEVQDPEKVSWSTHEVDAFDWIRQQMKPGEYYVEKHPRYPMAEGVRTSLDGMDLDYGQKTLKLYDRPPGTNKYGNKVGYHAPEISEKCKDLIEKGTGLEMEDCSWHNDMCDSLYTEGTSPTLHIYLPNCEEMPEDPTTELWNTFTVDDMDNYGMSEEPMLYTTDINEVIALINKKKK